MPEANSARLAFDLSKFGAPALARSGCPLYCAALHHIPGLERRQRQAGLVQRLDPLAASARSTRTACSKSPHYAGSARLALVRITRTRTSPTRLESLPGLFRQVLSISDVIAVIVANQYLVAHDIA